MVGTGFDDEVFVGARQGGCGRSLERDVMRSGGRIILASSLRAATLGLFALAASHAASAQIASVRGPGPGDPRI